MSEPKINYVPEVSLRFRWKLLISVLLLLVLSEGWVLKHTLNAEKQITPEPHTFVDDSKNNIISVKGSWTSEKEAYPIQASSIDCYKSLGYCDEALAEIRGNSLIVFNDLRKITSWTKESVNTLEKYQCAQTVIHIDRQAKVVTAIRSGRNQDENNCRAIPAGPPMLLQLVDGFKVWQKANGVVEKQ